jgi:hypothetical protein
MRLQLLHVLAQFINCVDLHLPQIPEIALLFLWQQLSYELYPQQLLPFSSIRNSFFLSALSATASSFLLYPQQLLPFSSIRNSFFPSALSAATGSTCQCRGKIAAKSRLSVSILPDDGHKEPKHVIK